jgi:phosphate transport system permease protein
MSDTALPENAADRASSILQRRRNRTTRKSVLVADRAADWIISVGGILVIVAVFGIMAFLAEVVVPLFTGGTVESRHEITLPASPGKSLLIRMDEYRSLVVELKDTGEVVVVHAGTGTRISAPAFDLGGKKVTAFGAVLEGGNIVFGLDDGSVRFGRLRMATQVLTGDSMPPAAQRLDETNQTDGAALYTRIAGNQIRRTVIETTLDPAETIAEDGSAIVAVDYREGGTAERPTRSFVTVDANGAVRLSRAEGRLNMLTRQMRMTLSSATLPALPVGTAVTDVLMTSAADQVYVAQRDGTVLRYDTRDFDKPQLAETVDLVPGNATLDAFGFLIGEQSIIAGSSDGAVNVYFRLPIEGAKSTDSFTLVKAHQLEPHEAPVIGLAVSQRGKVFATADTKGNVWVRHSTSEQTLARVTGKGAAESLTLAPRDNGVLAITGTGGILWNIDIPHPESTWASIFGKVWYEGYPEPTYTWQSSSGNDSFEPKLSLVPLIFGTIKATLYTMLFAVPLALLAAIYTSEFVHKSVRATVKPVMEMMASLPSVVLGFIAALILAPFVEVWISAVILAFLFVPLALLFGAYLWQLLPRDIALRLDGIPKFALFFVVIAFAMWLTVQASPGFEAIFFAGDLRQWATGTVGSGTPFLALILFPLSILVVNLAVRRLSGDILGNLMASLPSVQAGGVDLVRGLLQLIVAGLLAFVAASALGGIGVDLRGGVVDTYVQRNTLVVSFAMGFAVIPIIYTIAEDAMNAVPEHLRAASLACGATPWQTAISVILPTAMSGVFAAIMIGMGRAVGETMIVVMAAGNTPILEWNLFNGLRALSANIAVELPEAVKDSTLYRMLFLAALALFIMTFVVNTIAEVIRQRFRKRAAQL